MHLLIPFASALSAEALQVLPTLVLPHLQRLLSRLEPAARGNDHASDGTESAGDAYSLSPPHERALAAAWGWHGGDGALPFAAHAARTDGIDVGTQAWGLLTPAHWQVGREHVTMAHPDALSLDADASRAAFDAVRGLFESEGCTCAWGAPDRWYVAHDMLEGLPCASLDRVIGRNVDFWLGASQADARIGRIRRLQSEVQLLLYPHPLNEAREARGALPINSFWLSGCGRPQAVSAHSVTVDDCLRRPLLEGDAAGWSAAWAALDGGALAGLLQALDSSTAPGEVVLTLCGERRALRLAARPRSLWQRLRARTRTPDLHGLLAAL